jgi:hypothetical protein
MHTNDIRSYPQTEVSVRTRLAARLAIAGLAFAAIVGAPRTASAEDVPPTAKGIVGCGLLGGEIVVFGEAIFGVRSPAAYLIGAGAGIAGGAVGGYFLEKAVSDGRIPAYTLAGGLALIIPALVVAFDQTRYLPSEGAREDKPVTNLPAEPGNPSGGAVLGAEPPKPGATPAPAPGGATSPTSPTTPTTPSTPPPPGGGGGGGNQGPQAKAAPKTAPKTAMGSLFHVESGSLYVQAPVPEVRPVFSLAEEKAYAVKNPGSEVRFPVMRLTF